MEAPASVDEYMAGLPGDSRAALDKLRKTIQAAAPEATDAISYGMPAFRDHGRILVYYAAFKEHYSLFPASKQVIADFEEELRNYPTSKGTIRFPMDKPLPTALVKKIVKARLAENAGLRKR